MKKFLINISVFVLIFFIVEKVFILVRNNSPNLEVDNRLELVLEGKMNKEVIVLGSSKGARNIDAALLEKKLGKSTFNLSYPGSNVMFHEFILRVLIKNNKKPKTVLLTLDDSAELLKKSTLNFRLDRIYPLVKYNQIQEELFAIGEKDRVIASLFVLGQMSMYNFDFRKKTFGKLDSINSNGSMLIAGTNQNVVLEYDSLYNYDSTEENYQKVESLVKIQEICRKNGIQLILVIPPSYKALNTQFVNRIKQLVEDESSMFIYPINTDIKWDKELFYDQTHLNKKGARLFTIQLADYLNSNF